MKYLGLVVVAVTACASVEHTAVTSLPPNPAPNQRMWFWGAYRPRGDVTEMITTCSRDGCFTSKNKVVQFADQRVVRDPEDLAPLVAPDSRTMREAHRATRAATTGHHWWLGGVALIVGGVVVGAHGNQAADDTERNIGIGVMVVGAATAIIASAVTRHTVRDARETAFAWYPHDLAEKLQLCLNGVTVMPCEAIVPGAPPPPPPRDPNLDQLRQK